MKTQVWVYIVVAVLSLGAGVAIAGVPRAVDRAPTIQPPVSTTTTTTTTTTTPPPSSESSDAGDDEEPAATDAPAETTTTTTTVPPAERTTLGLAVANGAEVGGAASSASAALEAVGYVEVGSFDGPEIRDDTVVYAADGFQSEAERLAQEIGIDVGLIFPIGSAPNATSLEGSVQLLVYLGRDVVDLPFFN